MRRESLFKKPGAKWDMERAMGVAGTVWGKEPTQCKKEGQPMRVWLSELE